MRIHAPRTALVSGVMALVIALYPVGAIVNADTPTDTSTTTPTTEATTNDASTATPTSTPPTSATPAPATDTSTPAAPAPATTEQQPAAQATGPGQATGATQPNGASGSTYTYNDKTGLWENGQYTWDPNTQKSAPKQDPTYSYNPSTGMWDTTEWKYDAPSGKYVANTVSTAKPPKGAAISNTGPGSSNGTFNNFYNAAISGVITSHAQSGDVDLSSNTLGGNATSGDALVMANLFNLLQSSASFLGNGNKLTTFNANIQGDVVGDLLLDPSQAANTLSNTNSSSPMDNLTVNNQGSGAIDAKVALDAQSGDVTVNGNTQAGNATTGNADAVANVVNLLNSTIGAGQSFLGAINIYGSLDGDILLPQGFLDSLIASSGPSSTNTSNQSDSTSTTASFTNNQAISNDVNAGAQSGAANVTGNTVAGNASTGNALTNVTILNMSSSDVIGTNNLLVFVNVLGKWYGVIMDAPAGSTAASLGGGITKNSLSQADNTAINSTTNGAISNDIDVNARSGDADVTNNTKAGNTKTGNATASVNLANFVNSHLALSDWFGILFINVFGTWNGSFGVNTMAGNHPAPASNAATPAGSGPATTAQVFRFVPKSSGNGASSGYQLEHVGNGEVMTNASEQSVPSVLASSKANPASTNTASQTPRLQESARIASWIMPAVGLTLGALLLLAERIISRRQKS
jgi:hypothetical protein